MAQEGETSAAGGQPAALGAADPIEALGGGTPATPAVGPSRAPWSLTSKRVILHEQITQRTTSRLAAFYLEALRCLREGGAEVRIPTAGHMLRELQDGLRKEFGVPRVGGGAGAFFEWIRDAWAELIQQGRPPKEGKSLWKGIAIDSALARFLGSLHDQIATLSVLRPKQRDQHSRTLATLDPGFGGAPPDAQMLLVEAWMNFWDIFNNATHANDPNEFEEAVERFEEFLADRLIPPTFEKQTEIADFVRGVEGHA